jgi:hypothetical protein
MRAVALALALALLAAACGKKAAPIPPGPQSELIYPRQYPSR